MAVNAQSVSSNWEITQLLDIFPLPIRQALVRLPNLESLVEVVLDLGRLPEARFNDDFVYLGETNVTAEDLDTVCTRLSVFGGDNRAGIEQTLHRISAMRNRAGKVVGLTARVGRAVYGTIDIILDVIRSGKSVCLLGPPGVGKTTILRECARVLSEDRKRVVIVDTSNEIGGDGDIPHPGVGHARRMQVPSVSRQHDVMIEAVENHMPQVIVIDEIGTVEEAGAARTIAERGVQLIGTAHGKTLENLLMNPTLSDLMGGINTVTLSDEEARRRGTRKTVLERKSPPTFDVLIEIVDRNRLSIYQNVAETVDALLRGFQPQSEVRQRLPGGAVQVVQEAAAAPAPQKRIASNGMAKPLAVESEFAKALRENDAQEALQEREQHVLLFPYGVSRNKIERAIHNLGVSASIARKWDDADVVLTLKTLERKESEKLKSIAAENVPIYSIKTNTTAQIMNALKDIFALPSMDAEEIALREASEAIYKVLLDNQPVELTPQTSYVRRMQHQLAEQHRVMSRSTGMEPNRRIVFYRTNDLPYGSVSA